MAEPLEIDGRYGSGSGTLVRFAVALATALGRAVRVRRARDRREKPGLRPQHVAAVRACAALCRARVEGAEVGSREIDFRPGGRVGPGRHVFDIGTAGSATMLALGALPAACTATGPLEIRVRGGIFQDFAPSPFHLGRVIAPLLARMGARVRLELLRPGYVPAGAGELALHVEPARGPLAPLWLEERGAVRAVRGVALASHLEQRRVCERMAETCEAELSRGGHAAVLERVRDASASQAGAGLAAWAETRGGCRLGADRAGARRRSAEAIGRFVARRLLAELASDATVDRFAADQIVPFAALADGTSVYRVAEVTEHLTTNLWLAERFGARTRLAGRRVEIEGVGRPGTPAPSRG